MYNSLTKEIVTADRYNGTESACNYSIRMEECLEEPCEGFPGIYNTIETSDFVYDSLEHAVLAMLLLKASNPYANVWIVKQTFVVNMNTWQLNTYTENLFAEDLLNIL